MKKILLLLFLLTFIKLANSQNLQVPNGAFDNWNSVTYFENPDKYLTSNYYYSYIGSATVFKTTDKYHGTYALKVQTVAVGSDTIIGYANIGTRDAFGNDKLGFPFTEKPSFLHLWAKYSCIASDPVSIVVNFKKAGNYIETGYNTYYFSPGDQLTFKEYNIPLHGMTVNPDTVEIIISSSALAKKKSAKSLHNGNWLIVDYMNFTGAVTSIPNADFETWNARVNSDPVSWSTLNSFFVVQDSTPYALQSTVSHSGNAIRIKSREILVGNEFRTISYITTGKFQRVVFDVNGLPNINGGFKINSLPDSVNLWYKYDNSANPDDSALFIIDMKKGINTVRTIKKLPATDVYKNVNIPLPTNIGFVPDSANIIISAANYLDPVMFGAGNTVYVDDISFYYGGPKYKVSGTVTYDNTAATPLSNNVKVYLINSDTKKKDSTFTDALGKYQFLNVSSGNYTLNAATQKKYLNSGPQQGLIAMKYFVGLYTIKNDLRKKAGDVNLDTKINATDALTMNKRFVGLISVYKIPFWLFENPVFVVGSADIVVDFKGICAGDMSGSYIPPAN